MTDRPPRLRRVPTGSWGGSPVRARLWGRLALGLAALPLAAAWLPLGFEESVTSGGVSSARHVSLVASEGWGVVVLFLMPVAITAAPLLIEGPLAHKLRVGAAIGLGIGVVLGALTIGMIYLPALGALVAAAVVGRPETSPAPRPADD